MPTHCPLIRVDCIERATTPTQLRLNHEHLDHSVQDLVQIECLAFRKHSINPLTWLPPVRDTESKYARTHDRACRTTRCRNSGGLGEKAQNTHQSLTSLDVLWPRAVTSCQPIGRMRRVGSGLRRASAKMRGRI